MAFQDSFEEIAKDEDLTGETFRVLFYLYSKLDFENFISKPKKRLQMDLRCKNPRLKSHEGTYVKADCLGRPEGRPITLLPTES